MSQGHRESGREVGRDGAVGDGEVLDPGVREEEGDGLHEVEIYRQRCRIENGAQNLEDFDIDLIDESKPIVVGNFVDIDRPPFIEKAS